MRTRISGLMVLAGLAGLIIGAGYDVAANRAAGRALHLGSGEAETAVVLRERAVGLLTFGTVAFCAGLLLWPTRRRD